MPKTLLLIYAFNLLSGIGLSANNNEKDSLMHVYRTSGNENDRIDVYLSLTKLLLPSNLDSPSCLHLSLFMQSQFLSF